MSNYAIFRLERRSLNAALAMARHALRSMPTTNADPARTPNNSILVGPSTPDAVMADLRGKLPAKRRKDAVCCIEFFIGASPEAMRTKSRKEQDAYLDDGLAFIGESFGGSDNIVSAVVHRDETTVHMQVLLVPLLDGKLNAKKLVGDRARMSQLQTDFFERAGRPHRLRRGEKGSGAKHTSIRQFYGAMEAAGSIDALPPIVEVPPAMDKPSFFSSAAYKLEYAENDLSRRKAHRANADRQRKISSLAKLSLATHGRARRRLSAQLSERDKLIAATARARVELDQQSQIREAEKREHARTISDLEVREAKLREQVAAQEARLALVTRHVDESEHTEGTPSESERPRPR